MGNYQKNPWVYPLQPSNPYKTNLNEDPTSRQIELLARQGRGEGKGSIGYNPTFWEDPMRVARWHNAVASAPPGWTPPPWLDVLKLAQAYNYFAQKNGNTPWTEWKYLNVADPGRQWLQNSLQLPPTDYLWPQDRGLAAATLQSVQQGQTSWSVLSADQRQAILTDPAFDMTKWDLRVRNEMMADPSFNWSNLPWWQKPAHDILSNPIATGVVQSLPMAVVAGIATGGPGALLPLALGAVGGWATTSKNTWVNKIGAGALSALGFPSQFVEQGGGTLAQIAESLINPEKYGDISQILGSAQNLRAAWQSSRGALEGAVLVPDIIGDPLQMLTANWQALQAIFGGGLTKEKAAAIIRANPVSFMNPDGSFNWGKVWQIGAPTPQQAPEINVLMAQTRNAIVGGANPVETVNNMILQYGLTGTERDLMVKMVADPLMYLPGLVNKGLANEISGKTLVGQTLLGKAIENTFGPAAEQALRETSGLMKAGQRYSSIIRTTPDAAEGLGGIARFVAGITKEGTIRAGKFSDTQGLLDTPVDLVGKRGFINYLGTLTPDERAISGQSMAQDNLRAILWQFNDPAEATRFMRAVGSGDMETAATMAKALVGTPEFYTILPVLKDFAEKRMPDLLAVWDNQPTQEKITMLNNLADAMNIDPATLLDGMEKTKDVARSFEQFKQKITGMDTPQAKSLLEDIQAGRFTAEDMKSITDLFTGKSKIPWNTDLWNGMVGAALDDHFAEWAKTFFNLKQDSPFFRFSHALKSAQGILLMGGNPAYAIRNTINDMVTRAVAGVGGFMSPKTINSWMERFGIMPARMKEGIGMVGEPAMFESEHATARMVSSTRMGEGPISVADKFLRNIGSKMPFTKLSGWVEGMESQQAFAIGMRKMWGRIWNRDAGFTKMNPELTNALAAIDPRAPDMVYAAIEGGMNRAEIESAIYGQQNAVRAREYIRGAADKLGISSQQAGTMLDQLGVLDKLDTLLQNARTPDQIRNAFNNVDRYAQDQVEIYRAQELPARMVEVANRVDVEGAPAAMDILADTISRNTDTWLEHYTTFGDVFDQINEIANAGMRDKLLRDARITNADRWNKANAWEMTTYRGLMEALKWDKSPEIVDFMRSLDEVNQVKSDTYKVQLDAVDVWSQKWQGQWDNPQRWTEWDAMQAEFDASFKKMFKTEHDGMVAQGDAMGKAVGLRYGDQVGAAFNKGWADVVRFRDAMVAEVQKFRTEAAGMKYEQRQAAKAQFYQHEYPAMIVQFGDVRKTFGEDLQGAIAGRPNLPLSPSEKTAQTATPDTNATNATNVVLKQTQAELITQEAAAEVAKYDAINLAEEQNIAKIASDHGIPTADENGNPLPNAKLDLIKLVRQYGGTEGAHLRTWKDLTAHPDIVEKAFANKELRAQMQPTLVELPTVPTDVVQQMVDAVETGKITPDEAQAVVDKIVEVNPTVESIQPSPADRVHASVVNGGMTFKDYVGYNKWLEQPIADALNEMMRQTGESPNKAPRDIQQAIADKGGIKIGYKPDLTGEISGKAGIRPGLFTKAGMGLDDLVIALRDDGYILQSVIDNPMDNGGINAVSDMIRRSTTGEKIYPIGEMQPDWVKRAGGSKNAGMLVGQILAGVEDAGARRVQAIKSDAYSWMIDNIQNYPDARIALKIPFDEHTSPIVEQISMLERSLNTPGLDISERIAEASRLYENLPEDAPTSLHARLDAVIEKLIPDETKSRIINESDNATAEAQANANVVMTRRVYEEQLRNTAHLTEEQITATMATMDGLEKWYTRTTGEPGENVYKYYSGMNAEGTAGDLMQQSVLYEGQPLFQSTKGGVTFLPDKSAIMHFFDNADISTAVHENAHVWRRMMQDIADRGNLEVQTDLTTLEKWAGVKDSTWTTDAEEKFARGFERYLADGVAPTSALVKVFENFKNWMLQIYKSITGSPIDVTITPEVKAVFDRLMGQEPTEKIPAGYWTEETFVDNLNKIAQSDLATSPTQLNIQAVEKAIAESKTVSKKALEEYALQKAVAQLVTPALHQVGDIVRLQDGTQATITAVRPDATLELDNGRVVSAAAVERVATQDNMFGEQPPTQQTQLFQSADPRMPFGLYDQMGGQLHEGQVLDEGWTQYVKPLLDAMQEEAVRRNQEPPLQVGGADDATQIALRRYLNQVNQEMAGAKLQTVRWGEMQRDNALLNYNRRYGFDKYLDVAYPYQFWYTRSLMNWMARIVDRPAWFSNYARLRMAQNTFTSNVPERLRGKIAIPVPFLPKWMGNTLYIDPWNTFFPPAQFAQPFQTMAMDQNSQFINVTRIIQQWGTDGTMSSADAQQALQSQSGPVWDKAVAEASLNQQAEISNPFDFMRTMFGPAWYLSAPLNYLGIKIPGISTGNPGDIGVLPLTSTANAVAAVTQGTLAEPIGDILGMFAKPETWARKALGLPQNGEFGDYYIDRQLANMVADGEVSAQDAELAMMQRTGPAFDAAMQRVKLELAMKVPGAATTYALLHGASVQQIAASIPVSLFSAAILPAGELKFRGLTDKWNAAWDKYNAGDTTAINQFFTDHPEYEAYLARKKTPDERLRNFLVGQIWDSYMALSKADKHMVQAQIGNLFQQTFLDSNTRDYTALDVDTLATWARYLNGIVPQVPATKAVTDISQAQFTTPTLMPETLDVGLKAWEAERDSRFPGILDIQSMYYSLPTSQRDAFKVNFPQYNQYLNWRKTYIASHPTLRPFIDSYYAQDILSGKTQASQETLSLLKLYYSQDYQDPLYGAADYLKDASPILWEQLFDYQLLHQRPSDAAMTELRTIWEAAGKPAGTLQSFLDDIIMPTLNQ